MDLKTPTIKTAARGNGAAADVEALQHALPPLPYDCAALEPSIDARTMILHHDKHHRSYVEKLNAALAPYAELRRQSAAWLLQNSESIPETIRASVHDNAGGHLNHSLYWRSMTPAGSAGPSGSLATAITQRFESLEKFKTCFDDAGGNVFGSGWVWLVIASGKGSGTPKLEIVTTSGHDNPIQQGMHPLLLNDVWEHAYYLNYENRRPEYLKNWWPIVNWKEALYRFEHPDESTAV